MSQDATIRGRWRVARADLMLGLYAVGALNGLGAEAAKSIADHGPAAAAELLFGIDAVVLMAVLIGLALCGRDGRVGMAGRRDLLAGLGFAALVLLPHSAAGWLGLGALGLYGLFTQRGALAAAGAVFVAVALHQVAARLLLAMLTPTLTVLDAQLTTAALQALGEAATRQGNVITTGDGYALVIVAACVAFRAVAQGWLALFAFTRYVRPAWRWSEPALWLVMAVAAVGLNTVRLVLSGVSLRAYHLLHEGSGGQIFGLAILAAALIIAAYGVRHELWPPAADR